MNCLLLLEKRVVQAICGRKIQDVMHSRLYNITSLYGAFLKTIFEVLVILKFVYDTEKYK
jgi:hypothetical protein